MLGPSEKILTIHNSLKFMKLHLYWEKLLAGFAILLLIKRDELGLETASRSLCSVS